MAVHYFFERGKTYACNNTTNKWFENVREHKPHIFFRGGEWHFVACGSHIHWANQLCADRNNAAQKWMRFRNGELDGTNEMLRHQLATLSRLVKKKENV